ncbi:MAG: hypothetical protein ABIQ95_05345 [Bdellovibrionia bacterium]
MKNRLLSASLIGLLSLIGCSTLPSTKLKHYPFPKGEAFIGNSQRPYVTLGTVRSKVDFISLDELHEEKYLCNNYFNKSVRDLVSTAKQKGGDAVIDVKSVVYLEDGRQETYPRPECSDDGLEGQILTQGIVVKWKSQKSL